METHARARNLRQSLAFALSGLIHAARSQPNLRIHVAIAALVVAAGLVLRISRFEWALIAALIAMVIALELLNTAIEAVVDLASPSIHPLAKTAKDTAAAAILVAAVGSVVTGLFIFLPRLWQLIL